MEGLTFKGYEVPKAPGQYYTLQRHLRTLQEEASVLLQRYVCICNYTLSSICIGI